MKKFLMCFALLGTFSATAGMDAVQNEQDVSHLNENVFISSGKVVAETENNLAENFVWHRIPVHHYNKEIKTCIFGREIFSKGGYWDLYKRYDNVGVKIGESVPEAKLLKSDWSFWCFKYRGSNEGLPEEWLKFYRDGYPQWSK